MWNNKLWLVQRKGGWRELLFWEHYVPDCVRCFMSFFQELDFIMWAMRLKLSDLSKFTPLVGGRALLKGGSTWIWSWFLLLGEGGRHVYCWEIGKDFLGQQALSRILKGDLDFYRTVVMKAQGFWNMRNLAGGWNWEGDEVGKLGWRRIRVSANSCA